MKNLFTKNFTRIIAGVLVIGGLAFFATTSTSANGFGRGCQSNGGAYQQNGDFCDGSGPNGNGCRRS